MRIRKNILPWCLSFVSLLFTINFVSCNKLLDQQPLDFLTPSNSYTTEAGATQGVSAIYARVRDLYFGFTNTSVGYWAVRVSDLGFGGEAPSSATSPNSYSLMTPNSAYVVNTWNTGFEVIKMANVLIAGVEKGDPENFSDGEKGKKRLIAEGRFFRAWMYRYLASTFGDIPLMTEPIATAKSDFVRDPIKNVYEQMIEDFKYATENLPRPGEEAQPGKLTRGPAWHFLGETYLELDKPQEAIEALTHVVDDYNYHLMTQRFGTQLGNDVFGDGDAFYDLFRNGNQNLKENTEAMWVAQIELDVQGGGENKYAYAFGPRYFDVGPGPDGVNPFLGTFYNGRYTGYIDTFSRPTAAMRPTYFVSHLMWQDGEGDTRNAPYNFRRHIYSDNPASMFYGRALDDFIHDYGTNRPNLSDTTKVFFPFFTKGLDPMNYPKNPAQGGGGVSFTDWYALRFAETLLLRAEAYLNANKPDLAAQDINQVRQRSHAKTIGPGDVTIDFILDERARELWGEEFRLVTLRRTGKLIERVRKYNDNPVYPGAGIQDFNFRWPIPQEAIDLNSVDFPQNQGY